MSFIGASNSNSFGYFPMGLGGCGDGQIVGFSWVSGGVVTRSLTRANNRSVTGPHFGNSQNIGKNLYSIYLLILLLDIIHCCYSIFLNLISTTIFDSM